MTDNPQAETTLVEGPQTVSHNANQPAAWQKADLVAENAKLIRWHREDGDALAEMRGTIARLRAELTATPASAAPLAAGFPLVQGNCPACGSAGLFLGSGGYVTCSLVDCPEPDAATTVLEGDANWPAIRAAILHGTADAYDALIAKAPDKEADPRYWQGVRDVAVGLRALADEAQQPTPCSQPNPCEDGGDPCTTHEREQAHADGDHELCGDDCTAGQPSLDGALRIVSDWVIESNDSGGIDADDLTWRLAQAGYPLPDDEA